MDQIIIRIIKDRLDGVIFPEAERIFNSLQVRFIERSCPLTSFHQFYLTQHERDTDEKLKYTNDEAGETMNFAK